jgi:MoaA/NifB/PqqE/SkfB family radical SAM enzyme
MLRRGRLAGLARLGARWSAIHAARILRRPISGPILGTIVTNYSCNLRCRMCDLPLRVGGYARSGLRDLSTDEMLAVVDDFSSLGTIGLGFTGGEPLLRKDLFELLERSKRRGMITHLNSNGSLLDDEAARRIVGLEIDSVNLSLDGATRETHDEIRASRGSFDEVAAAVRRLRTARERAPGRLPRIKLVCVLGRRNLSEAERLVERRAELGADAVDFIPLHDFDAPGSNREESILSPLGTPDDAEAADVVRRLAERARTEPIENSGRHLALFPGALRGEPSPLRCLAGYNSLAVDGYGRIFPCVPWSNADRAVGNVREIPLRRFWKSPEYARRRSEVARCRDCVLNCQAELNLLFQLGRPGRTPAERSASSRSGTA